MTGASRRRTTLLPDDDLLGRVDAVDLKNRLCDADCRDCLRVWLLRIVEALAAPTSMALACRWRSRPQHQQRTNAAQHRTSLFDDLVGRASSFVGGSRPSALKVRKSIDLDVRSIHDSCPFCVSAAMKVERSSGEPTSGLALSLARIAPISLVFIIALISVLSLLTIDVGVPAGARMADQYLAFNFGDVPIVLQKSKIAR